MQRGQRGAEALERVDPRAGRQHVESPAGQRLERERRAVPAEQVRHAQVGAAGVERRADRLGGAALARGPFAGVDFREADDPAMRVEACRRGGPLGGVGDQPGAGASLPEHAVERLARTGEQRERRDPAVVGERPEHGVQFRRVGDAGPGSHRSRTGQRLFVCGGGIREAATRDVGAGVRAMDDAQALADAVLRVGPLAAAGAERARHGRAVEQRVAARNGGIAGERHRGTTCVTNAALRAPSATALTTGAGTCSP